MQDFEQMMNLYHGIFFWCGLAAILFLVLAAVLFFVLKIPQVFGELSGRVARKAIAEMVEESSESGGLGSRKLGEDGRRHRTARMRSGASGTLKLRRRSGSLSGSLATGKMGANAAVSGNLSGEMNVTSGGLPPAGNLSGEMSAASGAPAYADMTGNSGAGEATLMGSGAGETTLMGGGAGETTLMGGGAGETTVMAEGASETTVLESGVPVSETTVLGSSGLGADAAREAETPASGSRAAVGFVVIKSIVEVHTDEVVM